MVNCSGSAARGGLAAPVLGARRCHRHRPAAFGLGSAWLVAAPLPVLGPPGLLQ